MRLVKNLGMKLLAIYLILLGASGFIGIPHITTILPILALITGVLLLLDK